MQWAIVKDAVIQSIVAYDPDLPCGEWQPPEGTSLEQVNDWLGSGNKIDDPYPPPVAETAAEKEAPVQPPTKSELQSQLSAIAAQIAALPDEKK